MAKYNNSVFGNISGEVLGVVASSNKGINFIKGKAKTTDSKTQKQLARRAIYEKFCELWRGKRNNIQVESFEAVGIKKNAFQDVLGFALKFSESASMMCLSVCPTAGTMSAPVFTKTNIENIGGSVLRMTGVFLFPAFNLNEDFVFISAAFGKDFYDYSSSRTVFDIYALGEIHAREHDLTARMPNTTKLSEFGQKMFRSFWYVNKKTGQISKPLCLALDESGNIETFYPFGK